MTTTPIADLLGIRTEKHPVAFRFTFRERNFIWLAAYGELPEILLQRRITGLQGVILWCDGVDEEDFGVFASALAPFEAIEHRVVPDAILSEARAAIAAQGGGK